MIGITSKLAKFVAETKFTSLPAVAVGEAKKHILDCLGVTLAGSREEPSRIVADFVRESGGNPQASVLGTGFTTSASDAALANGTAAHVLDFDDVSWSLTGHPSASMLPAILAVAEQTGASGKDVLLAYVLALEVAGKLGAGTNPAHYELGWHATITLGSLGAAAAAAKLLDLDRDRTAIALGIGASEASGLRQNFGTMTKSLHAGMAARNGVMAAALARSGFTADRSILESRFGFFNVLCRGVYDEAKIVGHLGDPFDVLSPGVGFKQYPSCHGTHWALDAAIGLAWEHDIAPAQVQAIECIIPDLFAQMLIHSDPRSGLEGKFSMEFCMAVALLDRAAGLRQFSDARVQAPDVRELMKKVKVVIDRESSEAGRTSNFSHVTLRLNDGRTLARRVDVPKGMPECPLTMDEVVDKYRDCAGLVLARGDVERSIDMITGLDEQRDLSKLMNLMRAVD
ncbi:MAG: MmgE/PrpD family protein [Chloroflexi bacterium]|nr:MmgE/PrpD family protein [Chloroflexota bacterium]